VSKFEYEGEIEITMEEGCYPVVYLSDTSGLANKIHATITGQPVDHGDDEGWFADRIIHRARIVVEILELDAPLGPVESFTPPTPPEEPHDQAAP
jgi:hypothetical protein